MLCSFHYINERSLGWHWEVLKRQRTERQRTLVIICLYYPLKIIRKLSKNGAYQTVTSSSIKVGDIIKVK